MTSITKSEFPTEGDPDSYVLFMSTLLAAIERDGYMLVDTNRCSGDPLLKISDMLGARQLHARSDEQGVVGENVNEVDPTWRENPGEYRGVGNDEFEFHTDGTFVAGVGVDRPIVILLHCVEPAFHGGVNLLIDGGRFYESVCRDDPHLALELHKAQFTFCRDNMVATNQSIFCELDSARVGLRWRFDQAVYGSPHALNALRAFHASYIAPSSPDVEVQLAADQVLIIDNTRIMHARTACSGRRRVRRTWIADPTTQVSDNLRSRQDIPRALLPLRAYAALRGIEPAASGLGRRVGIRSAWLRQFPQRRDHVPWLTRQNSRS